jgi:hypothetical protein
VNDCKDADKSRREAACSGSNNVCCLTCRREFYSDGDDVRCYGCGGGHADCDLSSQHDTSKTREVQR